MFVLLSKHNKSIAWFFIGIFYIEFLLTPSKVMAGVPRYEVQLDILTPGQEVESKQLSSGLEVPVVKEREKEFISPRKRTDAPDENVTTGPTQPEMTSFQSVNANNMVDLFTGDFSYNIPLLDVGGYPVNIHYQSGVTMDQEASWVGLGWNINPGTISRNMRGLPDDFSGNEVVRKVMTMKENKTIGVNLGGSYEFTGFPFNIGAGLGLFHNTYKGWGTETSLNAGITSGSGSKGTMSAGLAITNNSQDGLDVTPSIGFQQSTSDNTMLGLSLGTNYNSRMGIQNLQLTGQMSISSYDYKKLTGSASAYISFAKPSYTPRITLPFTSQQFAFTVKGGTVFSGNSVTGYIRGYGSSQKILGRDTLLDLRAFGYLYSEKTKADPSVLLDFNRENDLPYHTETPNIAIPIHTYDTYSISGEGTGGMFRPYRNDLGFTFDHAMQSKSTSDKFSLDASFGSVAHGGVDIQNVNAVTSNAPWLQDNGLKNIAVRSERDTSYENVYFKNPGEKTLVDNDYLQKIGDDKLIRFDLQPQLEENSPVTSLSRTYSMFTNGYSNEKRMLTSNILRKERDKRTQMISWLTADKASIAALDKKIKSYTLNSFPTVACTNFHTIERVDENRRPNHISEISVLNGDGRRYIYGIPAYNLVNKEVTMSTNSANGDPNTGLVTYSSDDNSVRNKRGKENYYSREEVPAYAHSFLLSGILSPEYVDVSGDGITEDDHGDAVKFNYTRLYGNAADTGYHWRAPFAANTASYNEGLKTDSRDDKGSYSYGMREVWYLNSVESKTMIATFVLENRDDGYSVAGENGGIFNNKGLKRLKEINLYTKADFAKNGINSKPIKTVRFWYNYSLTPGAPGTTANGKLTLEKISFTYNKNEKGLKNPYIFSYQNASKAYKTKSVDRWGNVKDATRNPGAGNDKMNNGDFPYAIQQGMEGYNEEALNNDAAAWTLNEIKLPSSGRIKIGYEQDDYAFVQNKRAMQFFSIAGFSSSSAVEPSAFLYPSKVKDDDYRFVFINVSEAVSTKDEILSKYLEGVSKLYFKLTVKMPPTDIWGKGYETIPCYSDVLDYDIKPGSSGKIIWLELKNIKGNESPMATAAVQFLRLNLPSKAYPFSEPGDNFKFQTVINMLATAADNIKDAVKGFSAHARSENWCREVKLSHSFVRLNNPIYRKLGGGLRVKKVEIFDNWHSMTKQQMQESVYGQEYIYTTTTNLKGTDQTISSGVASYEPGVGGDENPFKVPARIYKENVAALAPANLMYSEEPFGETYFPAAVVGYSKVTVQSIHSQKRSATGKEITEYYTARDFPTMVEYTPLDNSSKKTYNPKISEIFKFNAMNYVTLSQGFKIELNDMHGKIKSQSSFGQNNTKDPISYTFNYYRLQNNETLIKRLSNKVDVLDSANGVINKNVEIGKEVEIMLDVREQTSATNSASIEVNVDWLFLWPPVITGLVLPLPSRETNRYRSVSVLKVVNRYGILDSVIHFEKGSLVSTRNELFDGETGEALLSKTNNEFDDPIYNFNYPAHWAYSGMDMAYKNTGSKFSNVFFKDGRLFKQNGVDTIAVSRHFESGDEILFEGYTKRLPLFADVCSPYYHLYLSTLKPEIHKIWAIDASKGTEKQKGIYFIDKNGKPFSGKGDTITILRSGKRNLGATSIGSISSLGNPVKLVAGKEHLVFDTTTMVLNSNAARFSDFWRIDSTGYRKDTTIIATKRADLISTSLKIASGGQYSITSKIWGSADRKYGTEPAFVNFEAASYKGTTGLFNKKDEQGRISWVLFDMSVPKGAVVKSADLILYSSEVGHLNQRNLSNQGYISRVTGRWPKKVLGPNAFSDENGPIKNFYDQNGIGTLDVSTRILINSTTSSENKRNENLNVTSLTQAMIDNYWLNTADPSIAITLKNFPTDDNGKTNRLSYKVELKRGEKAFYDPVIRMVYYQPCENGVKPVLSGGEYVCFLNPVDTFVCRPNLDTIINPYRWGILGNWRLDRAYTYYDRRNESEPTDQTNIRKEGQIYSFSTFWKFTNEHLSMQPDTTKWVWNSKITKFNRKGYEIENHDPLDRFNAGQYGYNQHLPVAVGQNSKNREMVFEGFEDYDYKTDNCLKCNDYRFADFSSASISTGKVHTGKYSLRVAGNQSINKTFPISSVLNDTLTARLSMKLDSTAIVTTKVTGIGTGLKMVYKDMDFECQPNQWVTISDNMNLNYWWHEGRPFGPCSASSYNDKFKSELTGYIQPRFSGPYKFHVYGDDAIRIYITRNGYTKHITSTLRIKETATVAYETTDTINFVAGELYAIRIEHDQLFATEFKGYLQWESSGNLAQSREIVPLSQLYHPTTNITTAKSASVSNDTLWCLRWRGPKPTKMTLDRFSPIQGSKMIISTWVTQEIPCIGEQFQNIEMRLGFNNGATWTGIMTPSGPLIDGWQRIEGEATIPLNATNMTVQMTSTSSTPVYFDDLRMHPFSSNMKSFVYDPINLRLMAELDENNYATFYEYDDDGTLIRVKKETERGIKTIKETRSALRKDND